MLDEDQKIGCDLVENVIITGQAGCGKTFLVKNVVKFLRNYQKNVANVSMPLSHEIHQSYEICQYKVMRMCGCAEDSQCYFRHEICQCFGLTKVMAEKFIGRWTTDLTSVKGADGAMEAYGVKEDVKSDFFKNKSYTDIQNEGEAWSLKRVVEGAGEETYTCKLGEEVQCTGLDGSRHKVTPTLVDGVLQEKFSPVSGKNIEAVITRTVNGSEMTVKTVVGGATSTMTMLKG